MSDVRKELLSKISLAFFALVIILFSVVTTSFKTEIKHDITLDIYEDGAVVGQTAVHMDGTRAHFLVGQEDSFTGRFAVDLAEKTCNEHTSVQILWNEGDLNHQTISFFTAGDFHVSGYGVNHVLLINPDMTEMAIQMEDGRVLASSEKVYDIYMEHITYHPDNGTTGIAGNIPEF